MANQVDLIRLAFALPRDADVAQLLGVIPQAVSAWRRRNEIPPKRRLELVGLAIKQDIALPDELWPSKPTKRKAPAQPSRAA